MKLRMADPKFTKSNLSGALLAVATILAGTICSAAGAVEPGFESIFNGKDLTGWEGHPKLWFVKDGAITGQTTAENPAKQNTFLIWKNGNVDDFELRCSYKIVPNNDKGFANSGIQYRSKVFDASYWVISGYQADMEAGSTYSGILYAEKTPRQIMAARGEKVVWNADCKKEVVGSLGKSEDIQKAIKKEDWNDYVIIAQGNHLQHFINGHQTVDVTDDCEAQRMMSGVLALQLHQGQPMTVQFKDLRLKKLSASGQSNADDLKKLQGAWDVAGVEINGTAVPNDELPKIVVTIKDKSYSAAFEDRTERGAFTIDPSKGPHEMDILPETGADAGEKMPGIYEITVDGFRVVYTRPGRQRPSKFSTAEEAGQMMIVYKRRQP
jgi:uncharacterized protein (TIGR03067 family)